MFTWIKERWLLCTIVTVLILALTYIYFPRDLEKKMGIKDVSIEDISHINLSIDYSLYSEDFVENDITNKEFISAILSTLKNQSMRKEVFSAEYYNPDPSKPTSVKLTIVFNDTKEFSTVNITNQIKHILIDNFEYKLYGDGIDAVKIWELTQQWKDS